MKEAQNNIRLIVSRALIPARETIKQEGLFRFS